MVRHTASNHGARDLKLDWLQLLRLLALHVLPSPCACACPLQTSSSAPHGLIQFRACVLASAAQAHSSAVAVVLVGTACELLRLSRWQEWHGLVTVSSGAECAGRDVSKQGGVGGGVGVWGVKCSVGWC